MSSRSGLPIVELLVVFLVVYLLQFVTAFADLVGHLFVLTPPIDDEPWTIVTSVYAHANPGHLISNAVALVLVGLPVALSTTRLRFHAFFLTAGAIAGVSQIVFSDALSVVPILSYSATVGVLGASGGVFALLGYLLASNRLSTKLATAIAIPAWIGFALFIVIAAVVTVVTASPRAALIAHFVGLLVGLVAGYFNLLDPRNR
ncbi:rhomboid family intramembrane serine protease [Halobacteriales archaeon QH_2_65_14]|nr:MAG: rhomboid family intramembrane serine protease [Halobacteriales archaeon QH_2_65_14]